MKHNSTVPINMYPELERMVAEGELKVNRRAVVFENDGSLWASYYKSGSDVLYTRRRYQNGNYDWYMLG